MVGGPLTVCCRCQKCGKTKIRSYIYGKKGKKCRIVLGYDANALYLYCSGQLMLLGKEKLIKVQNRTSQCKIERFNKKALHDSLFGFAQVDIEVPEELKDSFSEMVLFFVVNQITEVPKYMEKYREETGRKGNKNAKKLLGVMKAEKILLYTPLLKWYIKHGFKSHSVS